MLKLIKLMRYSGIDISHFAGLHVQLPFCWLLDNACFAFRLINDVSMQSGTHGKV